jgi:nucleotide-binding universal stress UspA family protein
MHVLIASDGSDLAIRAAQRGFSLLGRPERITLLSVVSHMPTVETGGVDGAMYSPETDQALWNAELDNANEELARTAASLHDTRIDKRVEIGDAATTICAVAEELGVDVIVVGSHGRTGLSRLFLGSTSEHVIRHAPCPVLVVRLEAAKDRQSTQGTP